jgi:hypothetical protein
MDTLKLGKIRISHSLYTKDYDIVSVIFTKFQPFEIEKRLFEDLIFKGICDDFREIKEGEQIPFYDCIFTRQEDGSHTFKFVEL